MKRKIFIIFVCCLFVQNILAQSTNFRSQMNTIFGNVDLSQVPSGILFDYGLNLADDSLYNGTLVADNILSPQMWKSLYADLWSSKVASTGSMPDVEVVNNTINTYASGDATLIPVLFYNYHRISTNALSNNLMYVVNNQLYDTPGRLQSPYIGQVAFAATGMQSRFETPDGVVDFVFRQDCYFTNSALSVSSIAVDAGDGLGYRTVQWGNAFSCNYATEGDKDVKVRFTFSDSSIKYAHFTITVDINIPLKSARYYNTETLTINPANVREYNGQKATGEVTIIYNGSTTVLDKPLIIFEGYDTWKIMYPNTPSENITWRDYIDNSRFIGYFKSSFQDALSSRGYDIVFVDFNNGTDYIQRNAYFAEAVINAVNQRKSGSEPNVVMGVSMGGLVSRYALADMEARSEDHKTRLFVSMDSPHQGANVPLGLQAMIRHLTDVKVEVGVPFLTAKVWDIGATFPEYSALINLLQQPATRQMLIQQLSGFGEGIYIDNSMHASFMQEYEQLGYPKQCRNIAVSNGSGSTSTSWQITPGSDIFNLSANCTGPWWTGFLNGFVVAASPFVKQLWEMPVITLASILPGNYGVKADFNIKALPNTGTSKIYDGEIKIVKKILWLIPVSSTLTSKEINYTGNGFPWDSSQGGNMSFDTYTGDIPDNLPSCVSLTPPTGNFCFVPAVSSLDIQGTQNLLKGYTAVSDLKNSMFDNIYTEPTYNVVHTNFNTGNTNWIVLELDKDANTIQQSNLYKFNGCSLIGPNIVCDTGATFSISTLPSGVDLIWTKSSNLTIDSSSGNYVVLKANSSGAGSVQAELRGGGTNIFSEIKTVWVGGPVISSISGPTSTPNYQWATYTAQLQSSLSAPTAYNWILNPLNGNSVYNYGSTVDIAFYNTGTYQLVVQAKNACTGAGYGPYYTTGIYVYNAQRLYISPNPAAGETILKLVGENKDAPVALTEWNYEIYDSMQSLKEKKTELKTTETKINTSNWKEGIYFVRAILGDKTITEKLIVKH